MDKYSLESGVPELGLKDLVLKNGSYYIVNPEFKNKLAIIKFYAPWCPHCTDMVDDLTFLARELNKYGFMIGAFNCTNETKNNHKIPELLKIQGFPTLMLMDETGKLMSSEDTLRGRDIESLLGGICTYTTSRNKKTCCKKVENKLRCD